MQNIVGCLSEILFFTLKNLYRILIQGVGNIIAGPGETAQWLSVLATPSEDQRSVPSTHTRQLATACNST